ncbi:probable UMP-CMP kinase 2 isoform X2 [Musa acuminata AAA Group]|uniref:probable UMP-CMP kinase 2 isoform X2 n=1 Tax=Musa acuminata AAA Group TaxID=214697 RepID=UPI0031E09031
MAFFKTVIAKLATEATSNRCNPFITFVLGGPGSGKGTQCVKIAETFRFAHLSAGDLLREEMSSNSENGTMIHDIIKDGKIVPSEITVNLLRKAIHSSGNHKFLIDGFPRNEENRIAFERIMRRSRRLRRGLVTSDEEEATFHLWRPAREGSDGSGLSRESGIGSPGSPFSSPSFSFSLG